MVFFTSFLVFLNSPLFSLYSILQFVLVKELGPNSFQITFLISAKPVVALLSSYWSSYVQNRPDRLKKNIIWASIIGVAPTLFFPFVQSNWFFIFGFAVYFFSERAIIPAWMELLKLTTNVEQQTKVVAKGSSLIFLAASIIPLFLGRWMDSYLGIWRWLFFIFGITSLLRMILQALISLPEQKIMEEKTKQCNFRERLLLPWNQSWEVLRKRPDFSCYQLIFFCGGLGLMVMQPVLPLFVKEVLNLSYTELAVAFSLCKGIGFFVSNRYWSRWIREANIFTFCGAVTFAAGSSVLLIFFSKYNILFIYFAFFFYGLMQAGSQLSWQLAGPIFSPREDSSTYTGVNIILVGVRGCIGPLAGAYLCSLAGLDVSLFFGASLCFLGSFLGIVQGRWSAFLDHTSYQQKERNLTKIRDPI